jgi:hypothetical protein
MSAIHKYPAIVKQKAKDFIATLKVSVKVRRYVEAYGGKGASEASQ